MPAMSADKFANTASNWPRADHPAPERRDATADGPARGVAVSRADHGRAGLCALERRVRRKVCTGTRLGQSDGASDVWNPGAHCGSDLTVDCTAGDGESPDRCIRTAHRIRE